MKFADVLFAFRKKNQTNTSKIFLFDTSCKIQATMLNLLSQSWHFLINHLSRNQMRKVYYLSQKSIFPNYWLSHWTFPKVIDACIVCTFEVLLKMRYFQKKTRPMKSLYVFKIFEASDWLTQAESINQSEASKFQWSSQVFWKYLTFR